MKHRHELTSQSTEVLSSPERFYIDQNGNVNEFEDLGEQVLFGTANNPRTVKEWAMDPQNKRNH
jgi:hypothetical protein